MKTWGKDAATQLWVPQPQTLVTIVDNTAVPSNGSVYFEVPIPDCRLRVKISTLFVPPAGGSQEFDVTGFANLWLAEAEYDKSGVSGRLLLATNIEGTEASPTAVPASAPLLGYSREFVTAADAIQGKLTILANKTLGSWILQCRYQPEAGQRFTPEEWAAIVSQANPRATSPSITF